MFGFRQIILILGVIFLFRLIGKVMTARRQVNEQKSYQKDQKYAAEEKANIGKTTISKIDKKDLKDKDFSSYKEVD